MVNIEYTEIGKCFDIKMLETKNNATVVAKPFYDPKKQITKKCL